MDNRSIRVVAACTLLMMWAGARAADQDSGVNRKGLSDLRLESPVTINRRYCTVSEILDEVQQSTGVTLRARPRAIADRNLLVFARAKPAIDVLQAIARICDADWYEENQGFQLVQSPRAAADEKRLLQVYLQHIKATINAQLALIDERRQLSKREIATRIDAAWQALRSGSLDNTQSQSTRTELTLLSEAFRSITGPLLKVISTLDMRDIRALLQEDVLRFSAAGHPRMKRLSPQIAREIIASRPDDDREWYSTTHPPVDVRAEVRLRLTPGAVTLLSRAQLVGVAPRDEPQTAEPPVTVAVRLDPSAFAGPMTEPKIDSESLNQLLSVDAVQKRVQKDDPSTYVSHQTISDTVASLANEASSIAFVADASLREVAYRPASKTPLKAILTEVCKSAVYQWSYEPRGVILLEDRLGFLTHTMALPAPELRSVMELSLKNQGLGLIDHARLASRWSNDQIRGLQDLNGNPYKFAWPPLSTYALVHKRDDLRFLASLEGRVETLVRQRSSTPLAALSKSQQRAVVEALDSVWYIAPSIDLFTESEFPGGAFQIIPKSPLSPPRDFEMIYSMSPPSRAQETRTIQLWHENPSHMPRN